MMSDQRELVNTAHQWHSYTATNQTWGFLAIFARSSSHCLAVCVGVCGHVDIT